MIINYKRILSSEQSHANQLKNIKCDIMYIDIADASYTLKRRSQLQKMIRKLKDDDIINVQNINILAPNFNQLISFLDNIFDKKVEIRFIEEGLVFKDKSYTKFFSTVAKFENDRANELRYKGQLQGMALNHYKGGKPKLNNEDIAMVRKLRAEGVGVHILTKRFNVSRNTIYNILNNRYNYDR